MKQSPRQDIKKDYAIIDERSMSHAIHLTPKIKPLRTAIYRLAVRFYRFMTVPQPF